MRSPIHIPGVEIYVVRDLIDMMVIVLQLATPHTPVAVATSVKEVGGIRKAVTLIFMRPL